MATTSDNYHHHILLLLVLAVLLLLATGVVSNAEGQQHATHGQVVPNTEDHAPCRSSHVARYLPAETAARKSKRQGRSFVEQAAVVDSDGIERTLGCKTTDNILCSMCCNGTCCERLTDFPEKAVRFQSNEQMWIPLKFTVLLPDSGNTEYVTQPIVDYQIEVLNTQFAKSGAPFRFHYHDLTFIRDQKAYSSCNTDPCYVSESCDFYTYTVPLVRAMDGNSEEVVNVFICDGFSHYDGEAQYPWASIENHNHQYVTIHRNALGNMTDYNTSPTGQGKTMVHEMGHYLGLMHTFEPGQSVCAAEGDFVTDTPTSKTPVTRWRPCDEVQDSCPSLAGNDQRENFMNYANDQCRSSFTAGQVERMERAVAMYRPKLRANTRVVGAGGDCGNDATKISDCECPAIYDGCTAASWCRRPVAGAGCQTTGSASGSGANVTTSSPTSATTSEKSSAADTSGCTVCSDGGSIDSDELAGMSSMWVPADGGVASSSLAASSCIAIVVTFFFLLQ